MCFEHVCCTWCQALVIQKRGIIVLVESRFTGGQPHPGLELKIHVPSCVQASTGVREGLTAETTLEG